MKVLDAKAMREVDRRAIEEIGIPGLVLMENAAIGVVEAIGESFPAAESAVIFCGPGNNGGDGLAIGRHLAARGYEVRLVVVHGGKELSADAGTQLSICRRMGLDPVAVGTVDELGVALAAVGSVDLCVDALFGTGLGRPLEGVFGAAVEAMGRLGMPVVAVDIPSGFDADRPWPLGSHVGAALTVSFAAPKLAQVIPPGSEACGQLVIADLGIPPRLIAEAEGQVSLSLAADIRFLVPRRASDSHKGDHGHLLLVAGAPGKAGAVILAARAAVRAGAGLVTVGVPRDLLAAVDAGSLESMTQPLAAGPDGRLAGEAVAEVLAACEAKDALAMGPGMGAGGETGEAIRRIALACPCPLLLDADGVNAFAGQAAELRQRRAATVLTPHPGELVTLTGWARDRVREDRLGVARQAAELCGAVVVLKGHRTLVAAPDGRVAVNTTGNAGLASGGTGDVLTGIVGSLLAQGLEPFDAARLGVFVHGLAADLVVGAQAPTALAASDLPAALGTAWQALRESAEPA